MAASLPTLLVEDSVEGQPDVDEDENATDEESHSSVDNQQLSSKPQGPVSAGTAASEVADAGPGTGSGLDISQSQLQDEGQNHGAGGDEPDVIEAVGAEPSAAEPQGEQQQEGQHEPGLQDGAQTAVADSDAIADAEPVGAEPAASELQGELQQEEGQQVAAEAPSVDDTAEALSVDDAAAAVLESRPSQPASCSSLQRTSSAHVSRSSSTSAATAVPAAAASTVAPTTAVPTADAADDDTAAAAQVSSSLQHVFSTAACKRSNLHLLEDGTLAMAAGCAVLLLHLPSMQQRFLPGRDGGGVAAVGVHPSRKLFLVAEKCRSRAPNIYIYSYPDLVLRHTLPSGTERAYSAACFSPDGARLAAVGSAPDYLLTLWDWEAGATLLRCKAFSQEVYALGFCPHSPGALVSCGTGHIRFWKMASTFTGLKLQGALGRFGAVELSDVAAFVELPDGKVLSGSEAGDLLLWEGGLIKAVISRPGGARCHDGPVEVLMHDTQTNYLLSGGGDGVLRLWEVARVQEAEPPEGSNTVEIKPAVSVDLRGSSGGSSSSNGSSEAGGSIGGGCSSSSCRGVRGLVWLDRKSWLVQSEAGALLKVSVPLNILDQGGYSVSTLMQLQPGGVVGCATCPDRHVLLAASGDGTISAIDYRSQAVLQQRRFSSPISSSAMLPPAADLGQRCMLLGFADGCVRLVGRCSDGWEVLATARPHKFPVVCLAVSGDGSRAAAVAADGNIFFLLLTPHSSSHQQQQQFEPLVACQLGDSSATCCCWDAAGSRLLVGGSSGVALEVAVPQPGEVDTSRSYHQQLPVRRFNARLPPLQKQKQQQEQQQQQQAQQPPQQEVTSAANNPAVDSGVADASSSSSSQPQEPAAKQDQQQPQPGQDEQQPAAASTADAAGGVAAAAAAAAASAEAVAPAEDNDEERPVLPITRVAYQPGSSESCLLWLGGPAAGQVLQCRWPAGQAAVTTSSSTAFAGSAVAVVSTSASGAYRLLGTANGQVLLEETGPAPRSWQCSLHDMHDGRVTGLAMAFDDSCLISAAADGTLLLLANPLGPPAAPSAPPADVNAGLPALSTAAAAAAAADGAAAGSGGAQLAELSLEEAKQAAQRDQQAATAAAARQQLLAAVCDLRQELAGLMKEDAARPPAERLPADAFHIDQGLPELIRQERQQRIASAQAQVAYDAEVAALKLGKLQAYFESTLAEHVVAVHPFAGEAEASAAGGACGRSKSASTIRPPELPREVQPALRDAEVEASMHQQHQQQGGSRSPGKLTRSSQSLVRGSQRASKGSFRARISQDVLGPDASKAGSTSTLPSSLSRAELWRQAKRRRAAEWAAFNASRPDINPSADAAGDADLQQAAATLGDFKLKSDPGFMLPEGERWTPAKKRRQMLLLSRTMGEARSSHNSHVLGLRASKRELLRRLNGLRGRLADVQRQLGVTVSLPELCMRPDEEPEQQLAAVTPAQLAEHAAALKAAADKAAGMGALGGFAAAAAGGSKPAAVGGPGVAKASAQSKQQQQQQQQQQQGSGVSGVSARELSQPELHRLQVERDTLTGVMSSLQSSFDSCVAAARASQLQLVVDLKAAEGRLLMMLKELGLLKDAESQELALEAKRSAKLSEAEEMAARLAELEGAMDEQRAQGEEAAARRAGVVSELEVLLAEQEGFREVLTKLFHRRIKRAKKHGGSTASGGDSSGDDSDGGGSDMGDDDGSGSDSSTGEEVCPPGCDPALYKAVVELREHRLDEEEVGAEVSRALEGLAKDKAMLAKKARLLDTALAAINQEVLDFQIDKQARLNQLPATVSLRQHQLALLDSNTSAGSTDAAAAAAGGGSVLQGRDLSSALVFSSNALERLKQRMQELDDERDALKHQQKELRHQHKQMQEDRAAKEARLAELSAHCTDVQMLKFGQMIDVSMLDTLGLRNKGADELREALKGQSSAADAELSEWDGRIASKRRELLGLLRENTSGLTTVTGLTSAQRALEGRVMAGREELWGDPLGSRRAALAERDRLVGRISSQGAQLEALRLQLAAMRRKDTALHG